MSEICNRISYEFSCRSHLRSQLQSHMRSNIIFLRGNGPLVRLHHSLTEYMKIFIESNDTWDECLELATLCYNTVGHEGHKFTAFELVFGRLELLP